MLRDLQWSVNSQKNATTGFSPHDLVFDFTLRDITQNRLLAAVHDDLKSDSPKDNVNERRQIAAANSEAERSRWKIRFDKRHARPTEYKPGDLVVIEHEPAATGVSRKLFRSSKARALLRRASLRNRRHRWYADITTNLRLRIFIRQNEAVVQPPARSDIKR